MIDIEKAVDIDTPADIEFETGKEISKEIFKCLNKYGLTIMQAQNVLRCCEKYLMLSKVEELK